MNSLKDRYKEYQETKPKVVLMVNDKAACNLDCACCYLPYEGVRDPATVLRIIENLQTRYKIAIAGSETLTDLRYLEAYRKAGQKYILTNGLLLDKQPELFDTLCEYGIEEIQMSFDFKRQKGGRGTSKTMIERVVCAAKERGFYVRLACIITPDNYQEVEQMCDQVKEMGADAIFFIRYIKSGSAKTQNKETLTDEQREDFFQRVDMVKNRFKKDEFDIRMNGNFGPKKGSKGERLAEENKYCFASRTLFSVDPNNNVYGCPYLMDTGPIGRLIDESRLEISRDLCDGNRAKCITDFVY